MEYVTIYETFERNEAYILKNIFEQHGIEHRLLDERTNDVVPLGLRLQVNKEQQKRAYILLRENGFLGKRLATTNERPSGRFWIYLFIGLFIVVMIAAFVVYFIEFLSN